jgi:hypothetical protein
VAYPTVEELVAATTVDELVQLTGEQQEGIRAAAIQSVEDYCHQSFGGSVVEAREVRGTRKSRLYLPTRLESLVSVAIGGAALSGVTLAEDGTYVELSRMAGTGYYEQAYEAVSGERFVGFDGILSITGTWGWTDCPTAVATAIRFDMEEQALADANELSNTIGAYRKLGLRNITQGNLRADIGDEVVLSAKVKRQLTKYVWEPSGELV